MPNLSTGRGAERNADQLLIYLADLELEVVRLQRQNRYIEQKATETLTRILRLCTSSVEGGPLPTLAEVESTARNLIEVVRDLREPPDHSLAYDRVASIAIRPLIEDVFRWQQSLNESPAVALRLDLHIDRVEWFPIRIRHLFDNLIANAIRYRDPTAAESWISFGMRQEGGAYQISVSDNGIRSRSAEDPRLLDLHRHTAPTHASGLGGSLSVVKLLVEQSGGELISNMRQGGGIDFTISLPRYDLHDYLE